MSSAVANFAEYAAGGDAWALGRFVAPLDRLAEFEAAAAAVGVVHAPWGLSALAGGNPRADLEAVAGFNARHAGRFHVQAIEAKAESSAQVHLFAPFVEAGLETYVEIPGGARSADLVGAIAALGARAKIRTGGVASAAFPSSSEVLAFVRACWEKRVVFKATAGLHHPIRGQYPLTYAADSSRALMFGFVNLFMTAASVALGAAESVSRSLLEADERLRPRFGETSLGIGDLSIPVEGLAAMRRGLMSSFGSCSFREPLDDLRPLLVA
jgi:hypothetical protein